MFTVGVRRYFIARHHLVGGDWGNENKIHSHRYAVEISLEGPSLNEHGYLMDIVAIEACLDGIISRLTGCLLNDLDEFAGLNPSIEHLADQCSRWLLEGLERNQLAALTVKVYEDDDNWASCRREIS
jgi:6-pyruvoyltetrahydropterin/6-carboxytetrahydropterin synthase